MKPLFQNKKKYFVRAFLVFLGLAIALYLFLSLKLNDLPESTLIYDRNNIEIGELPITGKIRHREIKDEEISEFYKKVLIFWEDRSFYYNLGISPTGIARSMVNNFKKNTSIQGASTLSAQYVRNNLWLNESRGIVRKALESYYAILLNLLYSKNEILTRYANQVYFGYLNYGLKSASIYYFDKNPSNLTNAEILALFTIQKNSNRYDPYKNIVSFRKRFEYIAKVLKDSKIITGNEYKEIINEKLTFNTIHYNKMPYISDFLTLGKTGNFNFIDSDLFKSTSKDIKTTFDYDLTRKIESISLNIINELAWKNVGDYSVLLLDKKTHELRVMIGGKEYHSKEGQVNSTLSLRQPGSTIKPFTYLLASANFGIKPNDTILDLPVLYKTKEGYSYEPKNYSTRFEGEVSYGKALAESMNVPAVKVLEQVGVGNLLNFLHKLGISSLNNTPEFYGLALTLGDGEVSLYELLRAYSVFSGDGYYCEFRFLSGQKDSCKKIIDKKYTDDINHILSNRYLKIGGYPINSALDFDDISVFFKTGTSRNFRDNWTIGYTKDYIIGVWVGNKDASNMMGVSGATGAGEIFGRIVRYLEPREGRKDDINTIMNTKDFLEITSPLDGSVFKIDRYTTTENQKIKLDYSSNISFDESRWYLDGKKIEGTFIGLTPGEHYLRLEISKNNRFILEKNVRFQVQSD